MQRLLGGVPRPSASLKDVAFKDVSWGKVSLVFDVEIANPYDVPLPLVSLAYGLTAGETRLLRGAAETQGTVPAQQSKVVSLPAEVSLLDAVSFLKGIRPGATIPYSADLKLEVDAPGLGRIPVPISRRGELSVPGLPGL